jgi:hypothetical protein
LHMLRVMEGDEMHLVYSRHTGNFLECDLVFRQYMTTANEGCNLRGKRYVCTGGCQGVPHQFDRVLLQQ